jgi:hypothetical protein
MCPRVVGIDSLRQVGERPLHAREIGELGLAHPRRLVADQHSVVQPPGHLAGIGDVAGLHFHPKLGDELAVGLVSVPVHLASGLHDPSIG